MREFFKSKKNIIVVFASLLAVVLCVLAVSISAFHRSYDEAKEENGGILNSNADNSGYSYQDEGIYIRADFVLPQDLDAVSFVKKAYELNNFFAVESFDSASDISVNKAVQYGFCYLYANDKCLVDINVDSMVYRSAKEEEIIQKITELFGSCPFDTKISPLYNIAMEYFEMWQPDYNAEVYASATVVQNDDEYCITAEYFDSDKKETKTATLRITVRLNGDCGYYIASMS